MSSSKGRLLTAVVTLSLMASPGVAVAQDDEPSPAPDAPAGPGQLGAIDEAYRDAFDVAQPWLDLGEDESGRTALEDGQVFMSVIGPDANYWDEVMLPDAAGVMRVEVMVELDGSSGTAAGPACGSAVGLPRWFVAGVNGGDEWWLGRLIDGRLQVVDRGSLGAGSSSRSALRVAIECASVPSEGGDHVLITVDDQPVTASMPVLDIPVGPYDKAGMLVATDAEQGSATFDDLIVHTGESLDAGSSPSPTAGHASHGSPAPSLAATATLELWPAPPDPMARTVAAGLEPQTVEHLLHHVHAHLSIFVDGVPVRVPAGIGIDITSPDVPEFDDPLLGHGYAGIQGCAMPCISPLHTHYDTGVLHTESLVAVNNRLGQFFTEWDVALDANCVGDFCEPATPIAVYLDGEPYEGDPASIELTDHLVIAIAIGEPPPQIPATYDFSIE